MLCSGWSADERERVDGESDASRVFGLAGPCAGCALTETSFNTREAANTRKPHLKAREVRPRPEVQGGMASAIFAVYTAIQRTRIVSAALSRLRATQHIHLVYTAHTGYRHTARYTIHSHTLPLWASAHRNCGCMNANYASRVSRSFEDPRAARVRHVSPPGCSIGGGEVR